MEFLSEIFIKYWQEVVVAVLLTATLPFIRMYIRRQRKKMINFFKEREHLKQSLLEAENKLKEAGELLESERKSREELERKLQAETEKTRKAQEKEHEMVNDKNASLYDARRIIKFLAGNIKERRY